MHSGSKDVWRRIFFCYCCLHSNGLLLTGVSPDLVLKFSQIHGNL